MEKKIMLQDDIDLTKLKAGEVLLFKCSEEIVNKLKLKFDQLQCLQNLYDSYLKVVNENASQLNIGIFIEKYTNLYAETEAAKMDVLKSAFTKEQYDYLSIAYEFDFDIGFFNNTLAINIKKEINAINIEEK